MTNDVFGQASKTQQQQKKSKHKNISHSWYSNTGPLASHSGALPLDHRASSTYSQLLFHNLNNMFNTDFTTNVLLKVSSTFILTKIFFDFSQIFIILHNMMVPNAFSYLRLKCSRLRHCDVT